MQTSEIEAQGGVVFDNAAMTQADLECQRAGRLVSSISRAGVHLGLTALSGIFCAWTADGLYLGALQSLPGNDHARTMHWTGVPYFPPLLALAGTPYAADATNLACRLAKYDELDQRGLGEPDDAWDGIRQSIRALLALAIGTEQMEVVMKGGEPAVAFRKWAPRGELKTVVDPDFADPHKAVGKLRLDRGYRWEQHCDSVSARLQQTLDATQALRGAVNQTRAGGELYFRQPAADGTRQRVFLQGRGPVEQRTWAVVFDRKGVVVESYTLPYQALAGVGMAERNAA